MTRRSATRAWLFCALMAFGAFTPRVAWAQADDGWQIDVAPLYFWAATTSGHLAINGRNVPIYLDFSDAKSKLAGAFALHVEARNGRWGVLGDVNFIRLSTDVNYSIPIVALPVAGTIKQDQVIVNGAVLYRVKPGVNFDLVGGVRAYTLSPAAHFTGPVGGQVADVDAGYTSTAVFGGFIYRPQLSEKVVLLTQADIGGGSALTWSAMGGVEFRVKKWMGLMAGYSVLGIDTGSVPTSGNAALVNDVQYAVTQYGPVFSLTFHWSTK
jgi:hypothetical protein